MIDQTLAIAFDSPTFARLAFSPCISNFRSSGFEQHAHKRISFCVPVIIRNRFIDSVPVLDDVPLIVRFRDPGLIEKLLKIVLVLF